MVEGSTLAELVRNAAGEYPDADFFLFEGESYTRTDVDERSERVANGLKDLGIRKGDHVALMMGNRPNWVWAWLGMAKLGAVLIPVNTSLKGDGLARLVDHSDAVLAIVGAGSASAFGAVRDRLPQVRTVVTENEQDFSDVRFSTLLEAPADTVDTNVSGEDDLEIIYTSGTTGLPKGVMTQHGNAIASAGGMAMAQQLGPGKTIYCVLPFYHSAAQFVCFTAALMSGARVAIAPRFSASRFWDDVRRYDVTSFNYYGAMLSILYKQPERSDDADNPAQIAFGAAAPKEIWEDFEKRFGVQIWEAYGQTEGGGLFNPPGSGKIGSMGVPLPGLQAKIVDDDGNELGPNETGELLFKPEEGSGRGLPRYYKDPEATEEVTRGGWLHTGDLAYRDEDGFYYFVDRKADFIRRRGMNISTKELESIVSGHPEVRDCAAYAIRSELGEDDVAVAVAPEGDDLDPAELAGWCTEEMSKYMVPRYIRVVDEIPRTESTGRVQKQGFKREGKTPDTWDRETAGSSAGR